MTRAVNLSPKSFVRKFAPSSFPLVIKGRAIDHDLFEAQGETLGKIGNLEVRLARTAKEVKKAQRLRYRVFYKEMSAIADGQTQLTRRDADPFDAICDHLLVIDHASKKRNKLGRITPQIVGTYRLLRQDIAERHNGFYTANEFDLAPLLEANPTKRFMELGRSCVLKPYRNKKTVELLWHGIWAYVLRHKIDVMIGCASIEGTNPELMQEQLSFLHHSASAPEEWQVRALDHLHVEMNRLPAENLKPKEALRALPPLIKGYLRIGAYIGDGAVVDHQFGTTDVFVIMPVSNLNARYVSHYGTDAGRFAS
ncbi:MAG: GNAT family N-acetyltransferase [Rhodobacteraceae bacterium]|nr:GNAT family N-acetyltransferase [Paracoccaceae bacterium]